mgnify:CR=1 FL=1
MPSVAVPQNVARRLAQFDPRLRLAWNERRKRFEVLERVKNERDHYTHVLFVETPDHKFIYDLGSGDFILRELRSRDARNRWGNDDKFMWDMIDGPQRDRERADAEFAASMSDDCIKAAEQEEKAPLTQVPKRLPCEKT